MGQGLGGLVAQNLSAAKPFPGDNPNLGPAHIVKSIVAFGAPIIGKKIAGVAYEFFKIKGDKLGDVPLDSVGVNDDRVKDVKELANPFTAPPWQTSDPKAKNYVKDPNDPSLIHNAYADSDQLKNTKLPFDITGNGGAWGPTYVVVIPPSSPTPGPMSASGAPVASGVGSGSSTSF
jgi:hypothetical protein